MPIPKPQSMDRRRIMLMRSDLPAFSHIRCDVCGLLIHIPLSRDNSSDRSLPESDAEVCRNPKWIVVDLETGNWVITHSSYTRKEPNNWYLPDQMPENVNCKMLIAGSSAEREEEKGKLMATAAPATRKRENATREVKSAATSSIKKSDLKQLPKSSINTLQTPALVKDNPKSVDKATTSIDELNAKEHMTEPETATSSFTTNFKSKTMHLSELTRHAISRKSNQQPQAMVTEKDRFSVHSPEAAKKKSSESGSTSATNATEEQAKPNTYVESKAGMKKLFAEAPNQPKNPILTPHPEALKPGSRASCGGYTPPVYLTPKSVLFKHHPSFSNTAATLSHVQHSNSSNQSSNIVSQGQQQSAIQDLPRAAPIEAEIAQMEAEYQEEPNHSLSSPQSRKQDQADSPPSLRSKSLHREVLAELHRERVSAWAAKSHGPYPDQVLPHRGKPGSGNAAVVMMEEGRGGEEGYEGCVGVFQAVVEEGGGEEEVQVEGDEDEDWEMVDEDGDWGEEEIEEGYVWAEVLVSGLGIMMGEEG